MFRRAKPFKLKRADAEVREYHSALEFCSQFLPRHFNLRQNILNHVFRFETLHLPFRL